MSFVTNWSVKGTSSRAQPGFQPRDHSHPKRESYPWITEPLTEVSLSILWLLMTVLVCKLKKYLKRKYTAGVGDNVWSERKEENYSDTTKRKMLGGVEYAARSDNYLEKWERADLGKHRVVLRRNSGEGWGRRVITGLNSERHGS